MRGTQGRAVEEADIDAADEITAEVPAQGVVANLGLVHEGGEWLVVGAGLE
ncbi:MAG TPA: hypothetical protein VK095_03090 [Beutenbergiaceae bacterium]|nr:hypothetical protein [Beutenbergiaceae bacterium]